MNSLQLYGNRYGPRLSCLITVFFCLVASNALLFSIITALFNSAHCQSALNALVSENVTIVASAVSSQSPSLSGYLVVANVLMCTYFVSLIICVVAIILCYKHQHRFTYNLFLLLLSVAAFAFLASAFAVTGLQMCTDLIFAIDICACVLFIISGLLIDKIFRLADLNIRQLQLTEISTVNEGFQEEFL